MQYSLEEGYAVPHYCPNPEMVEDMFNNELTTGLLKKYEPSLLHK